MPWGFATSSIFHASFGRIWDWRLWPTDGADDFLCAAREFLIYGLCYGFPAFMRSLTRGRVTKLERMSK